MGRLAFFIALAIALLGPSPASATVRHHPGGVPKGDTLRFHLRRSSVDTTAVPPATWNAPASKARAGHWGVAGALSKGRVARGVSPSRAARPAGALARDIRVSGMITYIRGDLAWPQMPADNISVYVYNEVEGWCGPFPCFDELLEVTNTNELGQFDVTVHWDGAENPNLYVVYAASNGHVRVDDNGGETWAWSTETRRNFADASLYLALRPEDEDDQAALHIATSITRAWRWFEQFKDGFDRTRWNTPRVSVVWPNGDWTYYTDEDQEINVAAIHQWEEDTVTHEYGHHWLHRFGNSFAGGPFDEHYCNGVCDNSEDDCGHCVWCWESMYDAWGEGFPDWIADVVTRSWEETYGTRAAHLFDFENVPSSFRDSDGNDCDHNPESTEGFLAALLRDIEDRNSPPNRRPDQDDEDGDGLSDALQELSANILEVASTVSPVVVDGKPITPSQFLAAYQDAHPSRTADLWETAFNIGYDIDDDPPSALTGLRSTSHTANVGSPDHTVDLVWNASTDDVSGMASYLVRWWTDDGGGFGEMSFQRGVEGTSFTSPTLLYGTWSMSVTPRDRSGKSGTTANAGPFIIEQGPADLSASVHTGWASEIVPRDVDEPAAEEFDCPAPTVLRGGGAYTNLNFSGHNTGEEAAPAFDVDLLIDGERVDTEPFGPAPALLGSFFEINHGPFVVRGGRHTVETFMDSREVVAEADEDNNFWAGQWVWAPQELTRNVVLAPAAPPDATTRAGIPDGVLCYNNCLGYRFRTDLAHAPGRWNAVWAHSWDNTDDYDLALHYPSTGPDDGFASPEAYSGHTAGYLDAVIVNNRQFGLGNSWDVGVQDFYGGGDWRAGSAFNIEHVSSVSATFGESFAVTMPENEMLLLREFNVRVSEAGPVRISVDVDPVGDPVTVVHLGEDFTKSSLSGSYACAATDAAGHAELDVEAAAGYNCLVLYRNPNGLPARETESFRAGRPRAEQPLAPVGTPPSFPAIDLTVAIRPGPPELAPAALADWFAPLVPTPTPAGPSGGVPAPAVLAGNSSSTYLNCAVSNASPAGAPAGTVSRYYVDGATFASATWDTFPPDSSTLVSKGTTPWMVRGGRHTLVVRHDADGLVAERDESNNAYGEQWVWSPLAFPTGGTVFRPAPPARIAGWSEVTKPGPFFYNCDGLRTPTFAPAGSNGGWAAVAVMSGPGSDVDLRLHEVSTGAKSGFGPSLAFSGWEAGQSDYVLVNFTAQTPFRAFDVGVVSDSMGLSYFAEVSTSVYRGIPNPYGYGPFAIGAGHMLQLHHFLLGSGTYVFLLQNVSGAVDWGMTLHPPGEPYLSKSACVPEGVAWFAGPGQNEAIRVTVPDSGSYCLAVWKATANDLGLSGQYFLQVIQQTVDVPDGAGRPSATALGFARPNPFASSTTIAFELARSEPVSIELFDVRGALVRRLASGRWPAGTHSVIWDGRDEAGELASTGVYLARMAAGGYRATRRLVIVR